MKEKIVEELFRMQDIPYRDFQSKLIPARDPDMMIGVRTPGLRKYARKLVREPDVTEFLHALPHKYFDEDQLHAFILSEMKDFGLCLKEINLFLPYVDNWATCDQMSPKIFKKHKPELLESIRGWLDSPETYTVRFAIGMLMEHYLDDDFDLSYPEMVAAVRSEEYYINMMIAWYFATALAKQYEAVLPFIRECRLDPWTHNMAIRKSVESRRIPADRKEYLKSLRIRK